MYDWMVFIDFDGTITSQETLSGAMELLNPPGLVETVNLMLERKVTLSTGLKDLFSKVPSKEFYRVLDYIKTVPLRAGFLEFLLYLQQRDIPVVVVSGGITQMLDEKLKDYRPYLLDVFAVPMDISGAYMRFSSPYDDGVELLKKTDILDQFSYRKCICIGDSYSDFNMAQRGDIVFARDQLAEFFQQEQKPYHAWNDFFDIIESLKSLEMETASGGPLF